MHIEMNPYERYLFAKSMSNSPAQQMQIQDDMIYHSMMQNRYIDQIADRVLERINLHPDISEVVMGIEEINKRLDELGGN